MNAVEVRSPMKIAIAKTFPEGSVGQQGIATDGKHVYVQATHVLLKYNLGGKLLAKSSRRRYHHGGITYRESRRHTLGFRTANTTSEVMHTAIELMSTGASLSELTDRAFNRRPLGAIRIWSMALQQIQLE